MTRSMRRRDVSDVPAGAQRYDGLGAEAQALVRAEWAERMAAVRSELDLAVEFSAQGRTWTEVDDHGNLVVRGGES